MVMASNGPTIAAALWTLLGAVIGSYLATLLARADMADDRRNARRSFCDGCGRQLSWFELVPVLGYLVLRGRCRTCGAPIAGAQIAIETGCAALAAATFLVGLPLLAPLGWMVLALAFFDWRHLWLPDRLVAALALAALAAPPWTEDLGWQMRLIGGALGFAVLWFVACAYQRVRGREGLGGGDPKMFGALGLWTGPASLPGLLLLACVIGFADAARRARLSPDVAMLHLPFGTYLASATLLMIAIKILVSSSL